MLNVQFNKHISKNVFVLTFRPYFLTENDEFESDELKVKITIWLDLT